MIYLNLITRLIHSGLLILKIQLKCLKILIYLYLVKFNEIHSNEDVDSDLLNNYQIIKCKKNVQIA